VRVAGQDAWLLDQLGNRFVLLAFVDDPGQLAPSLRALATALAAAPVPVETVLVTPHGGSAVGFAVLQDRDGLFAQRYDARPGNSYLIRPDQHVAARWRRADLAAVRAALARATAQSQPVAAQAPEAVAA
jgi:3-(3-hydroxy-phenyl)propionate hydroxylase